MTEYRYEVYDFGHYPAEHHSKLDAMVEAGWRIHTCGPSFTECAIMWEREAAPGSEDTGPARGIASGLQDGPPEEHQSAEVRRQDEERKQSGERERAASKKTAGKPADDPGDGKEIKVSGKVKGTMHED